MNFVFEKSRPKIGDRIKVREFGKHKLNYHWGEVVEVTGYKVVLSFGTQKRQFRWRDGYESGYNSDSSGWQICNVYGEK